MDRDPVEVARIMWELHNRRILGGEEWRIAMYFYTRGRADTEDKYFPEKRVA